MSLDLTEILRRIKVAPNRDEAAWTYSQALAMFPPSLVDNPWPEINRAILERWTRSGLIYIKEKAWKLNEKVERGP